MEAANQTDLTQWPWPQIVVYIAFLAFLIFGGPATRVVALVAFVVRKTIGALVEWVIFLPPPLTADASLASPAVEGAQASEALLHQARCLVDAKVGLVRGSEATATLHVAIFAASAGVLSVLGASGLAMFRSSVTMLTATAVVLILAAVIADLTCLLRDYGYSSGMPGAYTTAFLDIEGCTMYARNLTAVGARKSRLVKVASICFIAGVLLLAINALWVQTHPSSAPDDSRFPNGDVRRPL